MERESLSPPIPNRDRYLRSMVFVGFEWKSSILEVFVDGLESEKHIFTGLVANEEGFVMERFIVSKQKPFLPILTGRMLNLFRMQKAGGTVHGLVHSS